MTEAAFSVCEQCKAREEPERMIPLATGGHICKSHWFDKERQEMSRRHHAEVMELWARIADQSR